MSRGKEVPGPIRDDNPCKDCAERFLACSDRCPKDERGEYGRKAWKAEAQRVKENRDRYLQTVGVNFNNKRLKRGDK